MPRGRVDRKGPASRVAGRFAQVCWVRRDHRTQGDRSPYLDTYLRAYTATWADRAPGSFSLTVPQGRH